MSRSHGPIFILDWHWGYINIKEFVNTTTSYRKCKGEGAIIEEDHTEKHINI